MSTNKSFRHNGVALVHTTPKGKLNVWREENGLYSIILVEKRATVAESIISKKVAIKLANDKEFLF